MKHRMRYKTIIIVLIILGILGLALSILPKPVHAPLGSTTSDTVDETSLDTGAFTESAEGVPQSANQIQARIGSGVAMQGVVIVPKRVLEDSRCPMNARCVWAGKLTVEATVAVGATTSIQQFTLGADATSISGKQIRLVGAVPEKQTDVTLKDSDYLFVFSIE